MRILVCGTNYGQSYIQAIKRAPKAFELAGIFALGSTRSRVLARKCGVPLYRTVESLPGDIDIACAAMGASGANVVLQLLEQGVHVLCEHPQRPDFLNTAFAIAGASGTCLHVNGHFSSLKAASAFIRHCNVLQHSADPSFIDVMATDRSLYGALEIVRRVMRTFEPFELTLRNHLLPFTVVQGTLGAVPVTFQVQHFRKEDGRTLQDGDPGYLVDHRIALGFPDGVLTLASMAGPVIWNFNCNCSSNGESPMWTLVYARPTTGFYLHTQRVVANLDAIRSLAKSTREHVIPAEQTRRHILDVSQVWERIGVLIC